MNPFERFPDLRDADIAEAIVYLDAMTLLSAADKQRTYRMQSIGSGMRILDLGCGAGDDVRALSKLVGDSGGVTGVERSAELIEIANARGKPSNVSFIAASADALPFEDGAFDAARAERVFQHLHEPEAAAMEMRRVVRTGGTALLFDQDWETLVVTGADPDVTDTILASARSHILQPRAGRTAPRWLRGAGFAIVGVTPLVATATLPVAFSMFLRSAVDAAIADQKVDAAAAKQWLLDLMNAARTNEFTYAVTVFVTLCTAM